MIKEFVVSGNKQNNADKPEVKSDLVDKTLHVDVTDTLTLRDEVLPVTLWQSDNFAHEWFADALSEAQNGQDDHARAREILFAVCFAESYLFEWVRDEVLKRDFSKLKDYFKPEERPSVLEKWKDIPKQLNVPDFNNWGEFCKLVNYRNGLIHGIASRPWTCPQPTDIEKPVPSKAMLDALSPGWAVRVVVTLVECLHNTSGTPLPTWLVYP
jgi:hypothetical protein